MKLVPVATIRQALGFEDMADINLAITSIMSAVTASMEMALDTSFDRAMATDLFYVSPHHGPDGNGHVQTLLRLRNGFIVPQTISVQSGATVYALDDDPITITNMNVRSYRDVEKGLLFDAKTLYTGGHRSLRSIDFMGGPYIRVTYSYGFDVDDTDPDLFDQDQVPNWLKEAAAIQARIFLADHSILKNNEATYDTNFLKQALKALMLSHLRFGSGSIVPM